MTYSIEDVRRVQLEGGLEGILVEVNDFGLLRKLLVVPSTGGGYRVYEVDDSTYPPVLRSGDIPRPLESFVITYLRMYNMVS